MGDTLNSLLQANRSSSVLQGIANPAQVNPLAAINSGQQAAANTFNLRKLQADQALGNILQQATDPNGNVDYQKAQSLAAGAGPVVQMGMQSYLTNNAQLRGAQINQAGALHGLLAGMSSTVANDPSDENLDKIDAAAAALGLPDATRAEIARIRALPQDQRAAEAYKHQVTHLDALGRLATQGYGTPQNVDVGGAQVPVVTTPGSPYGPPRATVGAGGVGIGLTPAQLAAPHDYVDAHGVTQHTTVGEYLKSLGVLIPTGGDQVGGAPRTPPQAGSPGSNAPPPPPRGTTERPRPAPAATTQPPPAATTPPATPPPATTTPPPTPPPETPPAQSGKSISGPQPGTDQDVAAYKAAQAAMPDQQKSLQAGTAALQAIQLARTGPGTSTANAMKAFMVAQGIGGADSIDGSPEQYQIARKNLLRFAQSNGGKVGTDLGLSTQLESNPNVDTLLNSVNDHILKQDIGLARQRIAQTMTAPGQGGTGKSDFGQGMGEHVQNFTAKTDPVAFAWDLLTPGERQEHLDKIAKQEGGMAKWKRSMNIARDTGAWSRPAAPPPPPPSRVVAPPTPAPNPLQPSAPY